MRIQFKYLLVISLFFFLASCSEKNSIEESAVAYEISFANAVHHEAEIQVIFSDVKPGKFAFRMSRTSPGRYALHEFAKNVYNVKATNSLGEKLVITRPDPYQWVVDGHDGTVHVSYTLFANRGDGTYSQVDETHAHLNIPATFMYAPSHTEKPIDITFNTRKDLNWKIATQLKKETENKYSAPNLQYFMDSPTELSNHQIRSFEVGSQKINFALHHNGTDAELDDYFEDVKAIVLQEKAVFGELPTFDFVEYTFLGCYIANASGDGMEHRNSTILTSTNSLAEGGAIGTVSHEFFHAWNVERIRPQSLEPFNFEQANMSGELWFAEGFTSYYTDLILCRAEIKTVEEYVDGLNKAFNYVWNSPGRKFFNPIEMSYQAPFVDAATSVDPVNRDNTFISYYSYGSVLGLALDLSLRNNYQQLNLDDYMKLVWKKYGKNEIPYTLANLHESLNEYAGKEFADNFFNNYIYDSKMPKYFDLLADVGLNLSRVNKTSFFGAKVTDGVIDGEPTMNSPAYKAGLDSGDKIIAVNGKKLNEKITFDSLQEKLTRTDQMILVINRFGNEKIVKVSLGKDPKYTIKTYESKGAELTEYMMKTRNAWLNKK